jgi:hypothetical protein
VIHDIPVQKLPGNLKKTKKVAAMPLRRESFLCAGVVRENSIISEKD